MTTETLPECFIRNLECPLGLPAFVPTVPNVSTDSHLASFSLPNVPTVPNVSTLLDRASSAVPNVPIVLNVPTTSHLASFSRPNVPTVPNVSTVLDRASSSDPNVPTGANLASSSDPNVPTVVSSSLWVQAEGIPLGGLLSTRLLERTKGQALLSPGEFRTQSDEEPTVPNVPTGAHLAETDLPNVPTVPALPNVSTLPNLPFFSVPAVPNVPTVPETAGEPVSFDKRGWCVQQRPQAVAAHTIPFCVICEPRRGDESREKNSPAISFPIVSMSRLSQLSSPTGKAPPTFLIVTRYRGYCILLL